MLRPGPPLAPGARVLVRLPSWLGDLVAAEPALRALAARIAPGQADEPDGTGLTLAAPEALLPVLEGTLPAAMRVPHPGRGGEDAHSWRGHDVAVLFTGSFRSAWTAWRAGIPRRVGWAREGRALLLTDAMRPARERGEVPLGLGRSRRPPRLLPRPFGASCAELVGLLGAEVRGTRPRLRVTARAREAVAARLSAAGIDPGEPFLLVVAGARPGSAKGLPAETWGRALALLAARRPALPAVLVGGPGEEEPVRAAAAAAGPARTLALVDPVTDLAELSALAAAARVGWSADGGAAHVLRAHGTPRIVVLGPTDPRHSAENLEDERRLRVPVPCGPCHRERCPLTGAERHRCMRAVEPEGIVARTLELLG